MRVLVTLDKSIYECEVNEGDHVSSLTEIIQGIGAFVKEDIFYVNQEQEVVEYIRETTNSVSIVEASCIFTKLIVYKCRCIQVDVHGDLQLSVLIRRTLYKSFNSNSQTVTIRVLDKAFQMSNLVVVKDVRGSILWIVDSEPLMPSSVESGREDPSISREDLLCSLKVLNNRVTQQLSQPLMSKSLKVQHWLDERLKSHPTCTIKFSAPGGDAYIFEFNSKSVLSDIIDNFCSKVGIEQNRLCFSIPRFKVCDLLNTQLYRLEFFPRFTIFISEKKC